MVVTRRRGRLFELVYTRRAPRVGSSLQDLCSDANRRVTPETRYAIHG